MAKSRTRTSLAREIYYILCLVMFIVSALFAVWGPGGWRELKKARLETQVLRARVDSLSDQNKALMSRIQNLRSKKETIEGIARKEGFAQDGEIIQQVSSDLPNQESSHPPSKP